MTRLALRARPGRSSQVVSQRRSRSCSVISSRSRLVQVEPAQAAVLDRTHGLRLGSVERRRQPHDLVPVLGLGDAGRRRPAPRSRRRLAGADSSQDTIRGPVGTPCRGTSSLTGRSAITRSSSPAADHTSTRRAKYGNGHPERERPLQPVHQQVLAVRRLAELLVQPGRPELLGRARVRVDPQRHASWPAPRRRPRPRRCAAGPGRSPSASACRPSPRAAARSARPGSVAAARPGAPSASSELPSRDQRTAAADERRVAAEHVADPQARHLAGGRRDSASATQTPMPSGSSTVNANRRPSGAQVGHARPTRPSGRAIGRCRAVGQPQHRQAGQPAGPLPAAEHRVEPQPGQRQVAAGPAARPADATRSAPARRTARPGPAGPPGSAARR